LVSVSNADRVIERIARLRPLRELPSRINTTVELLKSKGTSRQLYLAPLASVGLGLIVSPAAETASCA